MTIDTAAPGVEDASAVRSLVLLGFALVAVAACGEPADVEPDASLTEDAGPALPTAQALRDRVASCGDVVGGTYAPDGGRPSTISICGFPGAVAWTADLDVDCDGKQTPQCNSTTDPYFMNQTAATDSNGDPLDAATLPFVVIPGRSMRFDYRAAGLGMGSVVAVAYEDRLVYGVLGDVGPAAVIGEASYRMAELLGIDPDPSTGGSEGPVAYVAFTGAAAEVAVIEDHDEAVALGVDLARTLIAAP